MKKSVLDAYFPVAVSEIESFKPGTLVRFSARSPVVELGMGSIITHTLSLKKGVNLVVAYPLESREKTEALIHKLFTQKEADKLKEISKSLAEAKDWEGFAAAYYGMILDASPERMLVEGHYWLPQAALNLLEKKVHKPDKVTVRKVSVAHVKDLELRIEELSKLFSKARIPEE